MANILDSESKISPLSSPLGTSPESWKPQNCWGWFALVVGWTDPEGSRQWLGALLLGYYDPDGRLVYAGRVGAGINRAELERLWRRLQPLAVSDMPLEAPPPRSTRFGSPLVLSRVHWVRPELVAEVKYLTWTGDNLLRQVVYEGLREDKPAAEVRREVAHPKPGAQSRTVTAKKPVARRRPL
jgi:ATP-dependent DNA ligase